MCGRDFGRAPAAPGRAEERFASSPQGLDCSATVSTLSGSHPSRESLEWARVAAAGVPGRDGAARPAAREACRVGWGAVGRTARAVEGAAAVAVRGWGAVEGVVGGRLAFKVGAGSASAAALPVVEGACTGSGEAPCLVLE